MTERDALLAPLLQDYAQNPAEGVRVFREALALDWGGVAKIPDVYVNLGVYLMATDHRDDAEAVFKEALTLAPANVAARYNLGCLYFHQRRAEQAQAVFEQLLLQEPNHVDAMINLANVKRDLMQREEARALAAQAQKLAPTNYLPAAFDLFESTYDVNTTDADIASKTKQVVDLMCGVAQVKSAMSFDKSERPLKVGFVSGDLKSHPVGFFLQGWLPHVDRSHLSLHAFSMLDVDDVTSQKLRSQFEVWRNIAKMSDDEVIVLAAELGIDVLIDLSGHTDMNRLTLFARRAAPVQISWLGWYATTGVVNMDYFLTDCISSPAASGQYHTEKLIHLPHTRLCLCEPIFAPPVSPSPALHNKHITFGSLQSLLKITDATLVLWRQVLAQIPNARLQIRCTQFSQSKQIEVFKDKLTAFGLNLSDIELLPPLGYVAYLDAYRDIDVMLDTIPFSGGTTTAEALWMGVPTLTMAGHTLIARQGASLMSAAGLANWVAASSDEYIAKAVYWSEHLDELARLRDQLRERVRVSPLFDGQRFAGDFSDAIESAFKGRTMRSFFYNP